MITIYTITYNEEVILPYFIKWYRDRFPNCKIVVYDNESTDGTKNICLSTPNLQYIPYHTGNKLSDSTYLKIKNNAWKHAETDWVIVCDVDEFLKFDESMLKLVDLNKETMFKTKAYNMCNVENLENICDIKHGIRSEQYDKTILFNRKHIQEINYSVGCHTCEPHGNVRVSILKPHMYHMKFINEDFMYNKYKAYAERMCDENKKFGWGYQYLESEEQIRQNYKNHLQLAEKIR